MHQRRRLATCQLPDMNDELDVPLCAACHPIMHILLPFASARPTQACDRCACFALHGVVDRLRVPTPPPTHIVEANGQAFELGRIAAAVARFGEKKGRGSVTR